MLFFYRIGLVVLFLSAGLTGRAQYYSVVGPATVCAGVNTTYTYTIDPADWYDSYFVSPSWGFTGQGTVVSSTLDHNQIATLVIKWTGGSTGSVSFLEGNNLRGTQLVAVSSPTNTTGIFVLGSNDFVFRAAPSIGTDNIRWYVSATGGSAVQTGETYSPGYDDAIFYVTEHNPTAGCESTPRVAVTTSRIQLKNSSYIKQEEIREKDIRYDFQIYPLTTGKKQTAISYLDGLGRPVQQISVASSPDGKDIVQPMQYDAFGRSPKTYLPYVASTSDGSLKDSVWAKQLAFYAAPGDKLADDTNPFAQSVFESSPLGRVKEQGTVGNGFQPGSSHTVRVTYSYNAANEVRKFNSDGTSSGYYAANTLTKTTMLNPDGNAVITYALNGQAILSKQQLDKPIDGTMNNYLETYTLYDDFGRVAYTIQPKGVATLKTNNWDFNAIKDQFVFEFKYDKRGRLIEKKTPGAGWSYTVYDQMNRVVLAQDNNTRNGNANQWFFVKYDAKGRAIMSGLYVDATNTTRSALQTVLDNKNYDASDYYFEKRQASTTHGYSNQAFPTGNTTILNVNYYDDYDFNYDGSADYSYTTQGLVGEATAAGAYGLATGSKRLILGTSTWLIGCVFYDVRGRAIQSRSNNPLRATVDNLSTVVYDFEGKTLLTKTYHDAGAGAVTIVNEYEYDAQGRLVNMYQNTNSAGKQLLARYAYNALGQVVDKKLHGTGTTGSETFLQSVDYRYTLRGQLASINNAQLTSDGTLNDETNDFFGLELLYNTTDSGLGNTPLYNGSITAIKWKGPRDAGGADGQKGFNYSYDKTGKLETSVYKMNSGSFWNKETDALNESMTYDQNGNIKSLSRSQRKHQLSGAIASYTSETIDNLTYTYKSTDANSLEKVTDAASTSAAVGFDNGTSGTNTDYTYDASGNITSDKNKGIDSVKYNFLGKPVRVKFSDGRLVTYTYDAGGSKLTRKLYQGSTLQTTTHYVNGFVYEAVTTGSPALSFFGSTEGRVVKNGSNYEYQYAIADHQGNTRVVFTSATPAVNTTTVNFESSTNSNVLNYTRTNFELFDHTDVSGSTYTYSQKLTGASGSQVGVAKTMKVYPGDKVKIEAYAKYYNPTSTGSNITGFALALTGAFGVSSSSTGEALKAYNTLNNYGGIIAAGGSGGSGSHPKLFVNILLFDKDYNFLDAAWEQIDGGEQVGATPKAAHDYMSKEVTVKEAGYAYVFISNENPTLVEFYVDDVTITHTPTNVIQYNEYYAFGMQTNASWTRENNSNSFTYNAGTELNATTGWYETPFRGYDAALGRFMQSDPLAVMDNTLTPYHFAGNDPVNANDPSGLMRPYVDRYQVHNESVVNDNGINISWARDHGEDYFLEWSMGARAQNEAFAAEDLNDNAWAYILGLADGEHEYDISRNRYDQLGYWINTTSEHDWSEMVATAEKFVALPQTQGELWYYGYQDAHGVAYNPNTNTVYEINHPTIINEKGEEEVVDGKLSWLKGGPKSQVYAWKMSKEGVAEKFWSFRGGRPEIRLAPVWVANPDAATAFFEINVGKEYKYHIMYNNCQNYVYNGLMAGEATITLVFIGRWSSGQRPAFVGQ